MTDLFINTEKIIEWGGLLIIIVFVFAETGLLLGLIIPAGETLMFTCGVLVGTEVLNIGLIPLWIILIITGIVGDISGYYIGKRAGKELYNKNDTWYFKKKYLRVAEKIFLKHKRSSIIFGKFLPVVRPFIPAIAGSAETSLTRFISFSLLSIFIFFSTFIFLGYILGTRFPAIKDYIEWILPISVGIAFASIFIQIRKYKADLEE